MKKGTQDFLGSELAKDSVIVDADGKFDPIKREMAVSQTYKLDTLKEKAKRYGVTLNTYV